MKRIVVTGAAGFLGSNLTRALISKGSYVIGIDNLSTGDEENLSKIRNQPNFLFINMNVSDKNIINNEAFYNIDEIYHLASPASPKYYQLNPFETILANTIGLQNMLEVAREHNASFLFTSTSEAYGDPAIHPQPEDYNGNVNTWGPRACYDESKRLGEVYCYEYYSRYRVNVKVVRIFNTYSAGLRNDDGRVISNFVTQAITGQDITVYGDGSQTRSFCYVDDNIEALQLVMSTNKATGEIINIGNPTEYTILEVAELIKKISKSESKITFHPLPIDDPKVRRPVIDKAKSILDWEPKIDLIDGLTRTIHAYRENELITNSPKSLGRIPTY